MTIKYLTLTIQSMQAKLRELHVLPLKRRVQYNLLHCSCGHGKPGKVMKFEWLVSKPEEVMEIFKNVKSYGKCKYENKYNKNDILSTFLVKKFFQYKALINLNLHTHGDSSYWLLRSLIMQ